MVQPQRHCKATSSWVWSEFSYLVFKYCCAKDSTHLEDVDLGLLSPRHIPPLATTPLCVRHSSPDCSAAHNEFLSILPNSIFYFLKWGWRRAEVGPRFEDLCHRCGAQKMAFRTELNYRKMGFFVTNTWPPKSGKQVTTFA